MIAPTFDDLRAQIKDMEKMNALTEAGWSILQFTPQQVRDGSALAQILRCL